jgi:non-specific protein-tyrosine kinase
MRAVESLRVVDAHLIGNVLNMAPAKGPDAYGYGYAYRYTSTPGNKITPRANQTVPRRSTPTGVASATVVPTGGGRRRKTPAPVTGIPSIPPPTSTVPTQPLPAQSELDSFFAGQSRNGSI